MYESAQAGLGLVIGYIEHLQIITISNYSTIANSHILQFMLYTNLSLLQSLPSDGSSASMPTFLSAGECFTINFLLL
jgi:hypothetical protein